VSAAALTAREREIITVKGAVKMILRKLGATNRAHAVALFLLQLHQVRAAGGR